LVAEDAGNVIGSMMRFMFGTDFDFYIPLGEIEWTEEMFEMIFSNPSEESMMYAVFAITDKGIAQYHLSMENIRFGKLTIGSEGETTDLKAWIVLPGEEEETEITLKVYFSEQTPEISPVEINYENRPFYNGMQIPKGQDLEELIQNQNSKIKLSNENEFIEMTEDMVEGWPAADYTGWETIKITYQGLNDYYRLYFYDNEITTVISSGINEEVVVEKGQDLTEAISSLEAYVEFIGNTNDSISSNVNIKWFDLSEAELTVEGLTIEEGKVINNEGVYSVTFKISGMSHIYNSYWDEETQRQIDETINIPDFEITAVVVVVDKEDSTLKFVTNFDVEGEILGTDNGDSESDTLDFNGAKLKVYFDNDSENPTIIDIDESMVKYFDVSNGSQYFGINVDIKYAYEYKGIEYNLIYRYQKETPKQYTIRFVYDDNGTEIEISSITEDYNTEILFPIVIEGRPGTIINWESNNPNYYVWQDEEGFKTQVSDSDVTFTAVFETQEQQDPIEGEWVFAGDPVDEDWIGATISFENNGSFTLSVPDLSNEKQWIGTWEFLSGNNYNITLTDEEVIPGYTFEGNASINEEEALFILIQKEGGETLSYKFIRT
jgi:hypothetical protein